MSERASVLRRSEHPNQNTSPPVEVHFAEEHFPAAFIGNDHVKVVYNGVALVLRRLFCVDLE